MSTKETAEDKLIASIQKTRAGVSSNSKTTKQATRKKSQATLKKNRPARKKKKAAQSGATNKAHKQTLIDIFQHGKRVWPD